MSESNYKFADKIVVGIVTCNRPEYYKLCVDSIDRSAVRAIFTVNAGEKYESYPDDVQVHHCNHNPTVVGIAKNILLRNMRNAHPAAEFFFVIEDDVKIINNKVFDQYITTGLDSGLIHGQLSFALHGGIGGGNVVPETGLPKKKCSVKYTNTVVDFYEHSFAAFTFFHQSTFANYGPNLFDEQYLNAAEHLDLHQKLYKRGLGTPFFWFPDIANSHEYIEDQDNDHKKSAIRNSPDFWSNFNYSWALFKKIHGVLPNKLPQVTAVNLMACLEQLEHVFAQKQRI